MRVRPDVLLAAFVALVAPISCAKNESASPAAVDAGSGDAGLSAAAFLPASAYDCTATGPFEPPWRPHDGDCFTQADCTSPLVVGHRIATPFAPENSLAALRAAILLGVDIVETDIRLTADGAVVLIHDGDVDRTLEGTGEVDSFTLAEIQALPMKVDDVKYAGDFGCERVPTLDQVFALARDRIVVELEVKDTAAGELAAAYLRDHDLYAHAFLLCSPNECAAVRAAVADVPIMTRPTDPDEVAEEVQYTPPPIMVHIDPYDSFLTPAVLDTIHGVGAKAYANAFMAADIEALGSGRLEAYVEMYDRGLDVVQTELPHWALHALGRLEPLPQ